jgi:hypothetical protein
MAAGFGRLIASGSTQDNAATTFAVTTTGAVNAGEHIVVFMDNEDALMTGVGDATNGAYAKIGDLGVTTAINANIWQFHNAAALSAGSTITITKSAAGERPFTWIMFALTGLATTSAVDKAVLTGSGTGTSMATPASGTLAQADEISVAFYALDDNRAITPSASNTEIGEAGTDGGGAGTPHIQCSYRVVSATTTHTETSTRAAGALSWRSGIVTFKGAAGGTAHEQDINDTVSTTDAVGKAATHPLTEAPTTADSVAKAPAHPVADTATVTDAISKKPGKGLAEAPTFTDASTRAVTHPLTEAPTVTDAQAKAATHPVADTAVVSDSVNTGGSVNHTRNIDDTCSATDAISKASTHPIADTASTTDAQSKIVGKGLSEATSITDLLARISTFQLALTEAPTVTDDVNAEIPGIRWNVDSQIRWDEDTDDRWLIDAQSRW